MNLQRKQRLTWSPHIPTTANLLLGFPSQTSIRPRKKNFPTLWRICIDISTHGLASPDH